ncbi:MAG: alpha/beta hydrolase [Actinomycetota bacterium]|jgi:pimeloyl-ACP methyl ester carboxylesterase|nr:alpha/beta hydrolase [Actinomycetota bacterium]
MTSPHQIETFTSGTTTVSYEVHGSGARTLVYLHGLLLDAAVNRRLAQNLAAAGNRVVLLDLPGHGSSDKPHQASSHRMDAYAEHVVALLDHLGVRRAVVGGMSLGADVTLLVASAHPERVAGMVLEMPVLEQATPYAAMFFTPLLAATHYLTPLLRRVSRLANRVPRHRLGLLDQVYGAVILDPEDIVAVLHGILVGPVAPTIEERAAIDAPALVIGHRADWLHPLGDAGRLAHQLPNARLLEAHSIFELRVRPARITAEIAAFLDTTWSAEARERRAG